MSRGRKEIVVDEQILITLLEQYLIEHPFTKEIKISEITSYCVQQYENGTFPQKLSREFWGRENRQGRKFINQINSEIGKTNVKKFDYPIISTKKIIDTCTFLNENEKKYLISNLIINEIGLQKTSNKLEKMDRDYKVLQEEKENFKIKLAAYQQKIEAYESILFQWADISSRKDIEIVDALTTGKDKSIMVKELFKDILSENPTKAFLNINISSNNDNDKSNLVPISNSKKFLQQLDLLDE